MSNGPDWFRPKRYGYGAGLPLKWQGWALLLVTLTIIWTVVFWFPNRPWVIVSVGLSVAIVCSLIAAKTPRGGWRWSWGEDE